MDKFYHNNSYKLNYFLDNMEFIALLSSGQGTWAQVSGLIKYGEWDKIILLGDDFAKQFTCDKKFEFIRIDLTKKLKDLRDEFMQKLKGKIDGTEVALSLASGDGKEHMALISGLINLPVGIRFAALTKDGVIDL
jgi:hypothetical protein